MRLSNILLKARNWSNQYSNFPERYIKRATEQVYWRNPKGVQYRPDVVIKRKKFRYGLDRSWTEQFRQENASTRRKVFVEPILQWSFFRGDRVEILEGEDKGKQGIVKEIIQERNWVIVEGLNCYLRRIKDDKEFGGIYIKSELPLLVTTQVALVDPSDLKGTSIEWRYTEDGQHVRVSTRTGRIIPIPVATEETVDYKSKSTYKEQPKDTGAEELSEITFQPALKSFEMDIMDSMGIKEERIPKKSYWY